MDVEIFTRNGCKSSRRAKDFLTRHGIGFVERNLSADADARAEHARIGYRGVPVIRAEGTRSMDFVNRRWASCWEFSDHARQRGVGSTI